MHITKQSSKMKRYTQLLAVGGLVSSLSAFTFAHEGHDQMMQMDMPAQQNMPMSATSAMDHLQHQSSTIPPQMPNKDEHAGHYKEHGGQIYQATQLDTQWLLDEDGQGTLKSKLKTWVGTDENKLFILADYAKAESEKSEQSLAALYSRNIADFWDVQAGVNYRYNPDREVDKEQFEGVVGLHGMAQYFFETDAHLYIGQNQQWRFVLETERDLLLTQKLIMQPYLEMEWVLRDESKYATKTGLADAEVGVKTRYEIVKNRVMPFIDVGYAYSNGRKQTNWQTASDSKTGWIYGAGLSLKF
ncbi:copper resistance protein B [Acinetobacter colistiniresistens]|uniref:copper resistance protein B n=1 Tax=Acinetobacter colistiniresistens TaxID=280145 RepID=UPI00211C8F90|nr:copper resistance protein B [Acinetobacter colistiniresistens]UUM27566.1 copper resistance protein B [Acinetobacter colistiniresistens]